MATVTTQRLAFAMAVITAIILFTDLRVSALCGGDVTDLIDECSQYVQVSGPKIPPSSECCDVVKTFDVPCVCRLVKPGLERIVSMEKVVYVARTCGLNIQPGMICGSYTVPPEEMI